MANWLIKGGRVLDPATGRDGTGDVWIADGLIRAVGGEMPPGGFETIEAAGLWVMPGGLDMHVHLREPGQVEAETVETGCRAAAHGGMTLCGVMPNTQPPMDTPEQVRALLARGTAAGLARLAPCPCLTRGRAGRELADLPALAQAGARAFTDDGSTPADEALLRAAMCTAAALGLAVLDHALDPAARGHMHEGARSMALGIAGIPSAAEVRIVERDIRLARETGCALHIQHVSARESVDLIRAARAAGLKVTGEATPHHLALADADIPGPDTQYKMSPPLRSPADREALRQGVVEGVLSVLATDHAPHTAAAKARPFAESPNGVIGLETALGVTHVVLVESGLMPALEWVRRWTTGPAAVLGLPPPSLAPGAVADVTLFDPARSWTVRAREFASRSRNTPFEGRVLRGRPAMTLLGGVPVFRASWI